MIAATRRHPARLVLAATVLLTVASMTPLGVPGVTAAPPSLASGCPQHGPGFQPPDEKVLMVVGQDRDSSDAYVAGTGHVPGGFMTYSSIGGPVVGLHLPINFGGTSHGQHFLDTYPHSVLNVAVGITPLEVTNSGAYDANIIILADWLKAANRPIYLRLGYEFDNPEKANDPVQFVAAWRRIVDGLREQGVTNAAYVWHSGSKGTYQGRPLSAWYPGDDYVDWMAVSLFRTFQLSFADQMAAFATARGKPLMIAESTPLGWRVATQPAVWDQWFRPVLDFIEARDVKIWSYINQNWEAVGWAGWGDSRVELNDDSKARWLAEVTSPTYLSASPTLMCEGLGYGDPPPPPSPEALAVTPAGSAEGESVAVTLRFSPAGSATSCTIDHGDGAAPQPGAVQGDSCTGPPHRYTDDGAYTVTATVTNAGGSRSAATSHTVTNLAPVVDEPRLAALDEDGRRVVATAGFTDPGASDGPFTCTIDHGDGTGPRAGTVEGGTCRGPVHQYRSRPSAHQVVAALTDKDGGVGSASAPYPTA